MKVPEHLIDSLVYYITEGRSVGGFLDAVLCNDLMGTFERADVESEKRLGQICAFLFCYAPSGCYGGPTEVRRWLKRGEAIDKVKKKRGKNAA